MQFWNHETWYDTLRRTGRKEALRGQSPAAFYEKMCSRSMSPIDLACRDRFLSKDAAVQICCRVERVYYQECRPYYKMWPSILPAFLRCRLDVKPGDCQFPCRVFALRFSKESAIRHGDWECRSVLSAILERCVTEDGQRLPAGKLLIILPTIANLATNALPWDGSCPVVMPLVSSVSQTLQQSCESWCSRGDTLHDADEGACFMDAIRCTFMLYLLAEDPSVIQPDVLADDRPRFDASTDPDQRERLIAKARRRGIVGWRIGERYEAIPHYRRPHFALRHTGPGGTVPRVVPVKGTVVHRQKMTQVPTGFVTPGGIEVEPEHEPVGEIPADQ